MCHAPIDDASPRVADNSLGTVPVLVVLSACRCGGGLCCLDGAALRKHTPVAPRLAAGAADDDVAAMNCSPHVCRALLQIGMTTSNEPGYYEDGEFGLRIEK